MTPQTLFLGTCFACVAALGGFDHGQKDSLTRPVQTAAAARTAAPTVADRDTLRRQAASDFEIARVSAEGTLKLAQERCEALGESADDACQSRARDLYEDTLAAAADSYAAAGRQIALRTD